MAPRGLVDAISDGLNFNNWIRAWLVVVGLFLFGLSHAGLHKNVCESGMLALLGNNKLSFIHHKV